MKRVFVPVLAFSLVLLFVGYAGTIQSPPYRTARFFDDYRCEIGVGTGAYIELWAGDTIEKYADLGVFTSTGTSRSNWHDQISCMVMGPGIASVIVYEHADFGGKSKEFSKTTSNPMGSWSLSGDWWNDRISSIKLIPEPKPAPANNVVFYENCLCGVDEGAPYYIQLPKGEHPNLGYYNVGEAGSPNWHDKISGMVIGTGVTKVIVYEHGNYGGGKKEFLRTSSNTNKCISFKGDWWDNRISSIKIQ